MIARRADSLLPRRALIIKPSSLGDVVTAMPVLRGLKRTFPDVHVSWMLSHACAPLIAHDSDLDEVVPFDRKGLGRWWRSPSAAARLYGLLRSLRKGRYDWVIDLQGLLRSGIFTLATRSPLRAGFAGAREGAWLFYSKQLRIHEQHTVLRNIALAGEMGIEATGADMTLEISEQGRLFAEGFRHDTGLAGRDMLVCVPPTRWQSKQYPPRHWRTVIGELCRDVPVVLLGSPSDTLLCAEIADGLGPGVYDLTGRTTVPQMVGVIAAAAGVICCDSAAKFIAPAVGTDVVTLIGPTRVECTGPYPIGRAVVSQVACRGCLRKRCHPPICMELIDPAEVVAAARRMLERNEHEAV